MKTSCKILNNAIIRKPRYQSETRHRIFLSGRTVESLTCLQRVENNSIPFFNIDFHEFVIRAQP